MSNYTVTTNFGAKDSLPSGNAAKVIKGSEFTTEFNNIATASATKANTASPTFTGTVTIPTATITTANTTTANITTANCDNLTVEKAANSADLSLLIHNTGTGDADATLTLDSSGLPTLTRQKLSRREDRRDRLNLNRMTLASPQEETSQRL